MGQQPMPDLSLGFGDDLVRLRKLLQVINSRNEWVLVNHRGAHPEHVQDHLRVLRIILIPPVVQGLSGPRQRHTGDTMPGQSAERPAGALRYARAPRPGLLPTLKHNAQINAELSLCLEEKWGSRQSAWRRARRRFKAHSPTAWLRPSSKPS